MIEKYHITTFCAPPTMYRYTIKADACTGCTVCAKACPTKAIAGERKQPHVIDQAKCIRCGVCHTKCKFSAIDILTGEAVA
jgi:ferredoxin